MSENLSVNDQPVEGGTIQKLPRGKEPPPRANEEHVYFKDGRGDTYEARGKDLKGVTPGATIQFADRELVVAAVAHTGAAIGDLPTAIKVAREASTFGFAEQTRDALARATELAADPDGALAVAAAATELACFERVAPALEKGTNMDGGEGLLARFAARASQLGYHVLLASTEQDLAGLLS